MGLLDWASEKVAEAKGWGTQKAEEVETLATEKVAEVKAWGTQKTVEVETLATEKATEVKEWGTKKAEEVEVLATEKVTEVKEWGTKKAEEVEVLATEKVAEVKEWGTKKAEEVEVLATEKVAEVKEWGTKKAEEIEALATEKVGEAKEWGTKKVEEVKQDIGAKIKSNEVADAVINHPDKIKTGEVVLGAVQMAGGGTEVAAGVVAIGGSGGLGTVGGVYLAVDGTSNVMGGVSRIDNGLKGLASGHGGGDTDNFVKNKFIEMGPAKENLLSGENLYNVTQLGIGAGAIKKGIIELPSAVKKVEELTLGGSLVAKTVGISLTNLVGKGGSIAVDTENTIEAAKGIDMSKPTFDAKKYLERYLKLSSDIENKMGLSHTDNQQQNKGQSR